MFVCKLIMNPKLPLLGQAREPQRGVSLRCLLAIVSQIVAPIQFPTQMLSLACLWGPKLINIHNP